MPETKPKSAKRDILSIIFRLTLTCLVAGLIMGAAFLLTHDAKERNEIQRNEKVMYSLLGYNEQNPAPQSMKMYPIHRYILDENQNLSVGYVIPSMDENSALLVVLDLEGNFVKQYPIAHKFGLQNNNNEDLVVQNTVGASILARFADTILVVTDNGKRTAYILDGKYPGFKTLIHIKMALNDKFDVLGFEVLEHEEDPGLGAEITQPYFKNQFNNRPAEKMKTLEVTKDPMPDDYRNALTGKGNLSNEQKGQILAQHKDDPIYALTGATISSRSVLNGNKAMVKKFVYRIEMLDKVIQSQNIQTVLKN